MTARANTDVVAAPVNTRGPDDRAGDWKEPTCTRTVDSPRRVSDLKRDSRDRAKHPLLELPTRSAGRSTRGRCMEASRRPSSTTYRTTCSTRSCRRRSRQPAVACGSTVSGCRWAAQISRAPEDSTAFAHHNAAVDFLIVTAWLDPQRSGAPAHTPGMTRPPTPPDGAELDVAIVGAGAAGTYLAYRLIQARPDWRIAIFERSTRIGGRLWSVRVDGLPHPIELAFAIVMDDQSFQVATMKVDGSDLRILTDTPGYAETPDWSPDGSWLIYSHAPRACLDFEDCVINDGNLWTLWRMNADGSDQRLVGNPDTFDWEPRLSPDRQEVVFTRFDPANDWSNDADDSRSRDRRGTRGQNRRAPPRASRLEPRWHVGHLQPNRLRLVRADRASARG